MLNDTNTVIPFQLGNNQVRGSIVRLGTTVSNVIKRHNYPKVIESLLADALSITACIGSRMKHKGIFTLQAKGNGEVHTLFSDITNDGFLRGYAGFETECLNCENDLLSLMGSGHISFTLDQGEFSKRYQGIVSLEGKILSKSAEHYFNNSEQLKTRFVTFNSYDFDKKQDEAIQLYSAGLIMLQKMPNQNDYIDNDNNEEVWNTSLSFLSTLNKEEFLSSNLSSENILLRLFNQIGVTVFDKIKIRDQCRCSDEKVQSALETLSQDDLHEISDIDGNIKVVCEFCKQERNYPNKV
jgi:molecular chaperone Hsp33